MVGPGIESRWRRDFPHPVQSGPGAHTASCIVNAGSFPRGISSRGMALTTRLHQSPRLKKRQNYTYTPSLTFKGLRSFYFTSKKVRPSHYRLSTKSAHKCGKIVSPTYLPPLSPGDIPSTNFCRRLSRSQDHGAARRIKSIKNVKDFAGYRSCGFPACSATPKSCHRSVLCCT